MRIIDHGFMNKIPMFYMCDATKRICLLTEQNSLCSITSSLTHSLAHLLTHTLSAILFLSVLLLVFIVESYYLSTAHILEYVTHTCSTYYHRFVPLGRCTEKVIWLVLFACSQIHRRTCESAKAANSCSLLTIHTTRHKKGQCSN